MKQIAAVAPYYHNFKYFPYLAWKKIGGRCAPMHYPPRLFKGLAHRYELPWHWRSGGEARLRFVEPVTMSFDTFPDYAMHEVVPFIWDCWDCHFEKTVEFFKRHRVRTAIFTASQSAERMRCRMPDMNILHIPEGVDAEAYHAGGPLAGRRIDLLEYGRPTGLEISLPKGRHHVKSCPGQQLFRGQEELAAALADSKVIIALPRSVTNPMRAANVETLTQRFWECMLSGAVMVGKAPCELVEVIGYDPVIPLNFDDPSAQIEGLLKHISDYQDLVDRNRQAAVQYGSWRQRMRYLMQKLEILGYKCC